MSSVKELLKLAKKALAEYDWDEAIELSKRVLKKDKSNYFAHVFLGKANEALNNYSEAKSEYENAIKLDEHNIIAWKGLFVMFKSSKDFSSFATYDEYFQLCGQYAQLLLSLQLPLIDLINDIKAFRRKNPDCEESFLKHIRPGYAMSELIGRHILSDVEALERLLRLLINKEQQLASKLISRARMKVGVNDPEYHLKVNSSAWSVYENSEVDGVYNQLVNIIDDDEKRGNIESEWLEYRCKILKSMPKELKTNFFSSVKGMVADMVLIKHKSLLAWKLYFDWSDSQDLGALDLDTCSNFVQQFPTEPLAMIIYAWICSDFSPYDSQQFYDRTLKSTEQQNKTGNSVAFEEGADDDVVDVFEDVTQKDQEINVGGFSETNVVGTLQENINQCQQSILANRIMAHYYILQKEYEKVLPFIRKGTSCVATATRDFGALLPNSKNDFTLLYGTAYTYFEAPKNHSTALSLFEKVISEDPKNVKAKMGMGLIFIQRENWEEAKRLLEYAIEEFPENFEVLSNYGWCLLHLDEPDRAIEIFSSVLDSCPSNDPNILDFRALNYWRVAKCLITKFAKTSSDDLMDGAYKNLVKALKVSNDFVPAYTSLGEIYSRHYKDETRAFKCFFKALSLDPGDIKAALYLSEKYCESGNWESAAMICERIIKLGKAKSSLQPLNWPYRILGISYLERRKPAGSIEWLQSALRIDPSDVQSWIALGQAYLNCGRVEASIKVFERVLELEENEKYGLYFLAQAYSSLGEFEKSLTTYDRLKDLYPMEECFLVSEIATIVEYADALFNQGFLIKSANISAKSIPKIEHVICNINDKIQSTWISLSRALKICVLVQSELDRIPLPSLLNIFGKCVDLRDDPIFSTDKISLDELISAESNDNLSVSLGLLVLSAKYALLIHNPDSMPKTNSAALWHNLGCSELFAFLTSKKICFRDAAIECFKTSIKYQSNNSDTWVGLGLATMTVNFRVSQHCLIKALALNPKELSCWNYLGMLSLQCNDLDLANQFFLKAQSLAPQDSNSWLGLALILERKGKIIDSDQMFAHAFVLSNGSSTSAQLLHAKSVLTSRLGKGENERDIFIQQEFSTIAFGLDQYLKRTPEDIYALQLSILNFERLHDFKSAVLMANNLSTLLEKRFEHNQDEKELFNFSIINSQFARLYLGMSNFSEAVEKADLSLAFLDEEVCSRSKIAKRAYISNHVVLALSYLLNGDIENALEHSRILLEVCNDSSNIALLIFKVLCALGSEDASGLAIQELLEFISSHGKNMNIILTLAVFFIVKDRLAELKELSKQILELPLDELSRDYHMEARMVLEQISKKLGFPRQNTVFGWQKAAFLFPNNNNAWNSLSPTITKRVAENESSKVNSVQLSTRYCMEGRLSKIQKGIFLCPWNEYGISSLHNCF